MEMENRTANRDGMDEIRNTLAAQEQLFKSGRTRDLNFRLENLTRLKKGIIENEAAIMAALKADLSKSPYESYLTEVGVVLDEIRLVRRRLKSWARPRRVKTPFPLWFASSRIYCEPYGRALIITPWNYPFLLSISPLIGSMAAGNCSVIKPSEYAPHTAAVISEIMASYFDSNYITVIEGDAKIGEALLEEQFEYIFFNGSVSVGKIVMSAAAKFLTPVTLELGGKNPCIVDKEVNVDLAARRITFGKFINAGQTCIAPDYLWVHHSNKPELLKRIQKYVRRFYGEDPRESPDFSRIINQRHFTRLRALLDRGNINVGGQANPNDLYIAPTVISDLSWDDPIMQDEIFGPILPVMEFEDLSQVISSLNSRPKSLALYVFSDRPENYQRVIDEVSFGNGCINDTVIQIANLHLPFGGVGSSGMGGYRGKASFDIFSHKKSVLKKLFTFDPPLRYPPYKNKLSILKKILR